jgi:KUP system potassium uptake protein
MVKILDGGWFPVVVGVVVFVLLSTWKRGREILFERLRPGAIPIAPFIKSITDHPPVRVPGTAVFLTASQEGVPHAMLHNLNHNKVLHERVLLLTVRSEDIPHVDDEQRVDIEPLGHEFYRVTVHYGFKDEPDLPEALETACRRGGMEFNMMETSFFLSRQTLVPTPQAGMALWREKLFAAMSRNASSATAFFKIPTNRVVSCTRIELGGQPLPEDTKESNEKDRFPCACGEGGQPGRRPTARPWGSFVSLVSFVFVPWQSRRSSDQNLERPAPARKPRCCGSASATST